MLTPEEVKALNERFAGAPTEDLLRWAWQQFGTKAAFGTSFQGAGLATIHLARSIGCNFPVFTLDTGLLFPETVALKDRLEKFFGFPIEALKPDLTVEQQAEAHGPELWKREPDLCCTMRKVLPLQDKLSQLDCWITGLRRDQSATRESVGLLELHGLEGGQEIIKLNPVATWSRDKVWDYIKAHQIPYNPLQDQGYRSIGCWPCTSKSGGGENERGGRWVGFNKVECGIHTFTKRK